MKKEDYVTEDVAKALREKGFTEKCRGYYYNGVFGFSCSHNEYNKQNDVSLISVPSLAQAAKWLREQHKIAIDVVYGENDKFCGGVIDMKTQGLKALLHKNTYEQALNEGIKEALKMI